ncbi:MAG: hypothetical protein METHAR1v1_490014 [Methanothrix sp.]|nr:MAG: hypothetical protein METHAR1v1_490014 [Methanothrix sp.]
MRPPYQSRRGRRRPTILIFPFASLQIPIWMAVSKEISAIARSKRPWRDGPKAPPGSLHRPRGPSRPGRSDRRRAAIETPVSRRGGGDLSPICGIPMARSRRRALSQPGGAGARHPGGAGWGGGQKRWVGAKVARCGEGSIRGAFAFPESVIVCRFFYKDWTIII